jgi:hypothetical protein
MYVVHDIKTNSYGIPFFCLTDGAAERMFSDGISQPDTLLHAHPEDFRLYVLGAFDDSTGIVYVIDKGPVFLSSGSQYSSHKMAVDPSQFDSDYVPENS